MSLIDNLPAHKRVPAANYFGTGVQAINIATDVSSFVIKLRLIDLSGGRVERFASKGRFQGCRLFRLVIGMGYRSGVISKPNRKRGKC